MDGPPDGIRTRAGLSEGQVYFPYTTGGWSIVVTRTGLEPVFSP